MHGMSWPDAMLKPLRPVTATESTAGSCIAGKHRFHVIQGNPSMKITDIEALTRFEFLELMDRGQIDIAEPNIGRTWAWN